MLYVPEFVVPANPKENFHDLLISKESAQEEGNNTPSKVVHTPAPYVLLSRRLPFVDHDEAAKAIEDLVGPDRDE
jgi:hypothetical protein